MSTRRKLWITLGVLVGCFALVMGYYVLSLQRHLDAVVREELMPTTPAPTAQPTVLPGAVSGDPSPATGSPATGSPTAEPVLEVGTAEGDPGLAPADGAEGALDVLLLGSDARGSERGRSDVMILAHIPASRESVHLVSFTRDSWVTIPGHGQAKINAAYALGGAPLAVQTVERLTGVGIDHVAVIDFAGFAGLTTALGGVEVDNEVATHQWSMDGTTRYEYPAGPITLEGERALMYVRDRYHLPDGDLGRAARQRDVVEAILLKVLSPKVLADPLAFDKVAGEFSRHVTVDSGLTNSKVLGLVGSMRIDGADDVHTHQAPIAGFGRSKGGQSINLVDWAAMGRLSQALADDTMDDWEG